MKRKVLRPIYLIIFISNRKHYCFLALVKICIETWWVVLFSSAFRGGGVVRGPDVAFMQFYRWTKATNVRDKLCHYEHVCWINHSWNNCFVPYISKWLCKIACHFSLGCIHSPMPNNRGLTLNICDNSASAVVYKGVYIHIFKYIYCIYIWEMCHLFRRWEGTDQGPW